VTATNASGETSVASNGLTVPAAPQVSLKVSAHKAIAGGSVVISGVVRRRLAGSRTVAICRRLRGRLVVLKRLTVAGSGAFRWDWRAHGAGTWQFVARYSAAGHTFTSKATTVTVRAK
jgi:hypothetical protein